MRCLQGGTLQIALRKKEEAKLHVLHVCPSYLFSKNQKQTISLKEDAEYLIKNSLDVSKGVKKLPISITVIEGGETFVEILKHAEKVKAELIVMGKHDKVKLLDMFIGTTIERVIRKGIRPILMVRDKPQNDYENVLIGTDFSDGSQQAFQVAIELAPESNFHLVHCYSFTEVNIHDHMAWYTQDFLADRASEKLEKFIKNNKGVLKKYKVPSSNFHFWKVEGEAYSCLIRDAAKVKSDLIAIGTHSHVSLMPHKLGGTARDILSNPPCDVLIATGL